jgi:hypothetical protein
MRRTILSLIVFLVAFPALGQARAGRCWNPAEAELQLEKYKDMPGYANGRAMVVRRYCGLWGRGT